MSGKKRASDGQSTTRKAKKQKVDDAGDNSLLLSTEVDFPRGGGTTFTPLEVKTIRREAIKEADDDLFEQAHAGIKTDKRRRRKSEVKPKAAQLSGVKKDKNRIEHLNYKRITVGMKLLAQVVAVDALALIVSLPGQLFAHVPITQISQQLTTRLESMEEDDAVESELDEELSEKAHVPDLLDLFRTMQWVRGVVTAVHAPGSTDISGIGRARDDRAKIARRVELSLIPGAVNAGVRKADLCPGFTLSAAVKSIEDHGYILDLGSPDVSGFLSFKNVRQRPSDENAKLHVGQLLDVAVVKMSSNGRSCNVTMDTDTFSSSSLSEVTNVASVLPGVLVQSMITAVHPMGLNLQILGYFDGTVDEFHLKPGASYKAGKKLKARVLYDVSSDPPRFALSLADHVVKLGCKCSESEGSVSAASIQEAFPIGTTLETVKVTRTEPERGLIVEVQPGLEGFVHISQLSEDHVPAVSASSGPWKIGSVHRCRVTGYFPLDGILQLSMKPSVLEQKYFQVQDVQVGELIRGTVKRLTDSALIVSISRKVDGVIWPHHYADIMLKHPSKRFRPGGTVKCRVLAVDSTRKRIVLTAKKSLLGSTLPVVSKIEDAEVGLVTHAVVFKVLEKVILVEFYNGLKATVPAREASDTITNQLSDAFPVGKVVKVRIISAVPETSRILASIRQADPSFKPAIPDISDVEIGNTVEGVISEIHKEHVLLTLQPEQVRALISFKNMANYLSTSIPQCRASLKEGDKLEGLIVVARNPEKGIVIVAHRPKKMPSLPAKGALLIDNVTIGQMVEGRVTRHSRNGVYVKLSTRISGVLHPTDTADNYDAGTPFPAIDSILKATVIGIDVTKRQLTLSTRQSRMNLDHHTPVADRTIENVAHLKVGDTVRGFITNIAEHGLFVALGRSVHARVQIKELFDEYIKDWKPRFELNQVVQGRILSVDVENKKVEMTFRSKDLTRETISSVNLTDLHEGQRVDARVKKIEDYGLFLEIKGTKISGLCHKSELSDNRDADVAFALHSFREGDHVRAMILSVEVEKRRLSFGLKPSYFVGEEGQDRPAPDSTDMLDPDDDEALEDHVPDHASKDGISDSEDDNDHESIQIDMDVQSHLSIPQADSAEARTDAPALAPLKLQGGFQWSGVDMQLEAEKGSDSSSDEEMEPSKKRKKRHRKEIEQDFTADMHTKTPESNADFERLLLGSPNSSYLWVQYMSFQLQISEIEKAREIGRRALQVINFREEQEKLNVWIALLNLENVYGTEESLEAMFKDAARHNDSKTVHLRLASIFDQTEKYEKTEEQYKRTCKKFGQSSKVWTLFGEFYLKQGDAESARKLLPRSLQSLEKRKHLKTISKFAQLEYKLGDPERGKTIFEGIVDSHPKRWDLWSVYIDMEAGRGDVQSIRNLFDRVLALKMTSHKAKSFFKKWLALEHRLGNEEGAAMVKQKAVEWTQRAANP